MQIDQFKQLIQEDSNLNKIPQFEETIKQMKKEIQNQKKQIEGKFLLLY